MKSHITQQFHNQNTHLLHLSNSTPNTPSSLLIINVVNQIFIAHQIAQLQLQTQSYRIMKYYNQRLGLSKKYYSQLKKMKITKTSQSCSICQQPYQRDEIVIQFPCKHIFHKQQCIKGWLRINSKCPICKFDLEIYFRKRQEQMCLEKRSEQIQKGQKNSRRMQLRTWLEKEYSNKLNKQKSEFKVND